MDCVSVVVLPLGITALAGDWLREEAFEVGTTFSDDLCVIPAKAGIQTMSRTALDSRLRGNDDESLDVADSRASQSGFESRSRSSLRFSHEFEEVVFHGLAQRID